MLMNIILETPRLYLRELTKNDLIDLAEILPNASVKPLNLFMGI